jgi:membrane DNA delivery protein
MDELFGKVSAIGVAIIGVATVAVLVSKHAKTASLITNASNAFVAMLKITVSPVGN